MRKFLKKLNQKVNKYNTKLFLQKAAAHLKVGSILLAEKLVQPILLLRSFMLRLFKWFSIKKHNISVKTHRVFRTIIGFLSTYKKEILIFLHVTLIFFFLGWGLEQILPITVWRLVVVLYLLAWSGFVYTWNLFKIGIYLSD